MLGHRQKDTADQVTVNQCIAVTSHKCHGILNHQQLDFLFTNLLRSTTKKTLLAPCEVKPPVTCRFPSQRVSNTESIPMLWHHHGIHVLVKYLRGLNFVFCETSAITWFPRTDVQSILHENVNFGMQIDGFMKQKWSKTFISNIVICVQCACYQGVFTKLMKWIEINIHRVHRPYIVILTITTRWTIGQLRVTTTTARHLLVRAQGPMMGRLTYGHIKWGTEPITCQGGGD